MSININTIRHSASHLTALAVKELFKDVKFGIGPAIEDGFYYDFELKHALTPEDLPKIEARMKKLIEKNLEFVRQEISIKEATDLFKKLKQPYKAELITNLIKEKKVKKVSIYQSGDFIDLCAGPHIKFASEINSNAFKLTKIAGAYWQGSEKNKMLQRIYGVVFETDKELADYLNKQAEANKRDHRQLNNILDLYLMSDDIGAGLIILKPKGAIIRQEIENFWKKKHAERGYQYVYSPHIGKLDLWKKSGHWDFYRENLYSPMKIEETDYLLKPMNCPFHVQIYKSQIRSYRDLPLRLCELGTVYRYEKSGVLHGLFRVRGFTQDDAHIFCAPEQITDEILDVLDLARLMLASFGFKEYEYELALRGPKNKTKYLGSDKIWQIAEKALTDALEKKNISYRRAEGEAVFYGPKIDIKLIDALGRGWQGPTIQLDFNFPEKFDLTYINQKGKKLRPVMIHRTVLGAIDTRFIANLIEHFAGALPLWLSPVQAWLIPISEKNIAYARKTAEKFKTNNIRFELKDANETLSKKIREGETQKIPYLIVIGDKEASSNKVAIRQRGKGDLGQIGLEEFLKKIKMEIETKK